MKIGLIDSDLMDNGTRHPNLALMKIAGFYKDQDNEVKLIYKDYLEVDNYDKVFISKVFSFTEVPEWVLQRPHIEYGGTGFFADGGKNLDDKIEHYMPYYDLYKEYINEQLEKGKSRQHYSDYLDYSIGFTTRGCFRKCSFCVNKKYDRVHRHSLISEFLDESRPYIYLWDDNILAFPKWEEVLDDIEATGKPFQFRQGIDLRLMNDKKAKRFNNARYQGDFIFAFDHIQDRDLIIDKVQLWKRYSSKICKMYVISGYDSQDEKDIKTVFERIKILMKYGSLPYIMRYEAYKDSEFRGMYVQLARWCNQPNFFKKKSFREFCVANQDYHSNSETNCAAYQSMIDFERRFPEIAEEYFDLKFENENIYKNQYGYGRRFANKTSCKSCNQSNRTWEDIVSGKVDRKLFLELYFTKEIDLQCGSYENSLCINNEKYVRYVCDTLLNTDGKEIIGAIKNSNDLEKIDASNIPQFSDMENAMYNTIKTVLNTGNVGITFEDLGFYLTGSRDKKKGADIKYGENHAKLAALLDLVQITGGKGKVKVFASELGKIYATYSKEEQQKIAQRLVFRIPVVQRAFIEGKNQKIDISGYMSILSEKTQNRRRSNVENVIQLAQKSFEELDGYSIIF